MTLLKSVILDMVRKFRRPVGEAGRLSFPAIYRDIAEDYELDVPYVLRDHALTVNPNLIQTTDAVWDKLIVPVMNSEISGEIRRGNRSDADRIIGELRRLSQDSWMQQ